MNNCNVKIFGLILFWLTLSFATQGQEDYKNENELKKAAENFFANKNFVQAAPLFSQLVALYPKDPNYNFKYGASLIYASPKTKEAIQYLEFAASRPDVLPEAYFYLGKAYHLSYRFKEAITYYEKFKTKAKKSVQAELNPDREITMCNNGINLLRTLTDLVVYDKKSLSAEDFFRVYDLTEIGGMLIVKPEDFMTEYEKKNNIKTIMYLPKDAERLYFSRIEGKGENGRDIYFVDKMPDGQWGTPFPVGANINTAFDDDFPFIHPNGKVLYFSSKGHNSMGGYDIYKSYLNEQTNEWEKPINVDFAINTPFDDYLLITNLDENKGFFTSNRYSKGSEVNVYQIEMTRVPVDFSIIVGQFVAQNSKNAKITVQDMYNNTEIGVFETNPKGEYNIKLPQSGKFRFLVDQEGAPVIHSGIVELKNADVFKPMRQKMEIVTEGNEEKLIITNFVDEELPTNELPLSAQLLTEQADLRVNAKEKQEALAQAQKQVKPKVILIENRIDSSKTAQTTKPTTPQIKTETSTNAMPNLEQLNSSLTQSQAALNTQKLLVEKRLLEAQKIAQTKASEKENYLNQASMLQSSENSETPEAKKQIETLLQKAQLAHEDELAANYQITLENNYLNQINNLQTIVSKQSIELESPFAAGFSPSETPNYEILKDSILLLEHEVKNINTSPNNIFENIVLNYQTEKQKLKSQQEFITDLEKSIKGDEIVVEDLRNQIYNNGKKKPKKSDVALLTQKETELLEAKTALQNAKIDEKNNETNINALAKQVGLAKNLILNAQPNYTSNDLDQQILLTASQANINPYELANKSGLTSMPTNLPETTTTKQDKQPSQNLSESKTSTNLNFVLPVPDDAPKNLTASTTTTPALEMPKEVVVSELPSETKFADEYILLLSAADTIKNPVVKEETKAETLTQWANKLDTELFLLKRDRQKTKSEAKRNALTEKIDELENQEKLVDKAANDSYTRLSYMLNPDLQTAFQQEDAIQQQLELQSLSNVLKTTYNKTYNTEFNNVGDIDNDFIRLYKTREINERWLADIQTEINDLTNRAAVESNPVNARLINERIASLNTLRNLKEKEIDETNALIVSYAFQNPSNNVPVVNSGVTKERANSLAAQAQNLMVNSILLSDSANRVSDAQQKSSMILQANADYEKSKQLAEEASGILISLSKYATSTSTTLKFNTAAELQNADVNQLLTADDAESQPTEDFIDGDINKPNVDQSLFLGKPQISQASTISLTHAQHVVQSVNSTISALEEAAQKETDPAKKAELNAELTQWYRKQKEAQTQVVFEENKSKEILLAEQNALKNPELVNKQVKEAQTISEKFNKLAADSLLFAQNLRTKAETAPPGQQAFLIKQAETIEARTQHNQKMALAYEQFAEDLKRVQKSAEVRSQMGAVLNPFNFPTVNKTLTQAEVNTVENSPEWQQFKDIQTDYARALKEAEVMFKSAANQQNTAEAELKRAQEIRNRAASTSNIQERQSLIKQAEVLELSAKAKLKESQNMEAAGLDLALNAKTKKGELETFIANLNPSLSTMILAYNNKQITDSTSPTLANVQPQQAENQNENSNIDNSKIINNNTTTPQTSNTINPNINAFFTQTTDASPNVIYNPENKSIFKIGEANTAFYNEAQPIQFNPKLPNGLVYKVQIGAFNNRINPGTFRGFAPITAENTTSGLFRYSAGLFELYQVADAAKNEIRKLGYADAFVVAYYNGKRITASDARDMVRDAGAQVADLSNLSGTQLANTANNQPVASAIMSPAVSKANVAQEIQVSQNPQISDITNLNGEFYTVQIGVFSKPVSPEKLQNISPIMVYRTPSGFYRYNTGIFTSKAEAIKAKNLAVQFGISDAFVTAYSNTNRVDANVITPNLQPTSNNANNSSTINTNVQNQQPTTSSSTQQSSTNQSKPAIVKPNFKVQVGAYENEIPVEEAKVILNLNQYGIEIDESETGLTKYLVGNFTNYEQANQFKEQMIKQGLTDAFVVAFQGKNKITLQQATEILKQTN